MRKEAVSVNKILALTESTIFILAIFSFAFIINSSNVSADDTQRWSFNTEKVDNTASSGKSTLILGGRSGSFYNTPLDKVFTDASSINFEGADYLIKDIGGYEKLADGGLRFFNQNEETLFNIGAGDAKNFLSGASGQGIEFTQTETFDVFGTQIASGGFAHLLKGLSWSLAVVGATQLIGGLAGLDAQVTSALSISATAGIMTFQGLKSLGSSGFRLLGDKSFFVQNAGLIGVGVGVAVLLLTYKKTETKVVTFECLPWEAPIGGNKCEECNNNDLMPCSEYRCKSLGQACDLVNKGTREEKCVWVNPKDVSAPTITPWPDALTEGHGYTNHDTLPPSLGAKIVKLPNNCIQAFTPLEFGVVTNEPAQCKIDISRMGGFDNMTYYFGDSLFKYNHTEKLNLPSPDSLQDALNGTEAPEIPIDGNYNFFVRCRDANGNENEQDFVFQLCVDPSPDTTPPVIADTSIKSGSYVSFGTDSTNLDIYVNEPSDCKWSVESKAYDDMENQMSCSTNIYELNAQQLYTCSTALTGIKDRETNDFYFRCKDQPTKPDNERNENTQSYQFSLLGSEPLNVLKVGPNGTIFGSTETVEIELESETRNGAEEGKSICYFSPSGDEGSYVAMFNTNNYLHSQTLTLEEGAYQYFFRCVDAGGNSDTNSTRFNIEIDKEAPAVTRAYRADGLKIVTDEEAECSYSLNSCDYNFDEGIKMIYSNPGIKNVHFAEWTPSFVYYIKCRDFYGNQPAPTECSIVASASNVK